MTIFKKIISMFFCVFLLAGCTADREIYEYIGESDNWKAVYKYEVEYLKNGLNHSTNDIKITYIGDMGKIRNGTAIEYTFDIGGRSGSDILKVENNGEHIEIHTSAGSDRGFNSATFHGSEIGIMTVSWDGKYEEFEIKNTKK